MTLTNENIPAGTAEKLRVKLARRDINMTRLEQVKAELRDFLGETAMTGKDEKPSIIQHYSGTFNHVDRFNKILAHIYFKPRCESDEVCLLFGIFGIAIVQTWALSQDWNYRRQLTKEWHYVHEFGKELACGLNE